MTEPVVSRRRLVKGGLAAAAAGAISRARPARAATKIRVLTNWFAEAEHGGLYQALAEGLYDKAGLDVTIAQGGPQLNGMQLLAGGETDVLMSYDIQILTAAARGIPVKAIFTSFQFDLVGIVARPEVPSLDALKGHRIFMANSGYSTYWPWLKRRFGYTDDMPGPKGINLQTFISDPTSAVAGYITSEPYVAQQNNVPVRFFLFADYGYPSYANTMATTAAFLRTNPEAAARFTRASVEGTGNGATCASPAAGQYPHQGAEPQNGRRPARLRPAEDPRRQGCRRRRRRHHGHRHHDARPLAEDAGFPGGCRPAQGRSGLAAGVHDGLRAQSLKITM